MNSGIDSCTVGNLDHIGIAVTQIEEALHVFSQLLDSPKTSIVEIPELGLRTALVEQGETRIEFLEPLNSEGPIAKFINRRGEGLHHIAFKVSNIDAKLAQLNSLGIPLIDREPRAGLTGRIAFLNPEATHHVLVELVQPQDTE